MKTLIPFTTVLFLFIQSFASGQEQNTEMVSNKHVAILKERASQTEIDTESFKDAVGIYFLEEANFELEITMEDDKMYIISPFSKDPLIQKNETTLRELSRGVDLELIADNTDALKFTQNGYETTLKRVAPKTDNQ